MNGVKAMQWGQQSLCQSDAQASDSTTCGESLCGQRMWYMARRSGEDPAPALLLTPPLEKSKQQCGGMAEGTSWAGFMGYGHQEQLHISAGNWGWRQAEVRQLFQ